MSAVINSHLRSRKWLKITIGIITIAIGIFLILTAITAHATRSLLQQQFNSLNNQHLFKLNNLNGGLIWSRLQLGVDATAIEVDTKMQHWWLSTYIQGEIIDAKISSVPLAIFTGRIDSEPWNKNLYWSMQLHGNELNYTGFPVFHATDLNFKSAGTLTSKHQTLQWDAVFNLTSDSNYGPLRFEINLLAPNHKLSTFWHNAHMKLRAILPVKLWGLVKQWQPLIAQSLMNKNLVKQQNEVVIINAMFPNDNW